MSHGNLSGIMTILAFAAFLGVVFWAFCLKRKTDFDAAARLPLEDDQPAAPAVPAVPAAKATKTEDSSP